MMCDVFDLLQRVWKEKAQAEPKSVVQLVKELIQHKFKKFFEVCFDKK